MNRIIQFLLIIFITLINIINAEEYNPESILNQDKPLPDDYKKKLEEEKKKENKKNKNGSKNGGSAGGFFKTKTGVIVISIGAVLLIVVIVFALFAVRKSRKNRDENPYVETSKQDFLKNSDMVMRYENISSKDSRASNNDRGFNIGTPRGQNEDEPFPESNVPKAHTKDSSPMTSIRIEGPSNSFRNNNNYNFNSNKYNNNEEDEPNNFNNSPYEKLIKDKSSQYLNVYNKDSNPNRTSSLIGDDEVDRLNGMMDKDKSGDGFINYHGGDSKNENVNIPPEFRNLKSYRVIHNFIPHRFDELEVQKGQLLKMVKSFEDGWSLCYNTVTRKKGFIPRNKLHLEEEPLWNNNQAGRCEKTEDVMNNDKNENEKENENENVNKMMNQPNNNQDIPNNNKDIPNNNEISNNNNSNNNKKQMNDSKDINQSINESNDSSVNIIPEFDKGKLILKKYDKEDDEKVEHQIVIEDSMFCHNNSCHVIFDYTDTSTSFNTSSNTLQSPISNDNSKILNDSILKPRNFVPTKSKLQSMEIGSEMADDEEEEKEKENKNPKVDESIDNYPNDNSFSDASVQQLSLGRQLLSFKNVEKIVEEEEKARHQRTRSVSQPLLPSDEVVSPPPTNRNRPRSRSIGRMEFENRHRFRNSELSIETDFNKGNGYRNSRYRDDDFDGIVSPRNNYNYNSEPRRKSQNPDFVSPKPNYGTEPRVRNVDEERNQYREMTSPNDYERDSRFERNGGYTPRMRSPQPGMRSPQPGMRSPQPNGMRRDRSKSRSPTRAAEYRGDLRSPSNASSFRGEPRTPRTPTANSSFRSEPRTPRMPAASSSFKSDREPRTPRTPGASSSFRSERGEPRTPRTPGASNSFRSERGEPRTPGASNSFRSDREPRTPRTPRIPEASSSFKSERGEPRTPRTPGASSSFRSDRGVPRTPRIPEASSSFKSERGEPRTPRTPTANSSFRSEPRTPRTPRMPESSNSFKSDREPRTPRTPTANNSFRSDREPRTPRTPTANNSFKSDREPRTPRMPGPNNSFKSDIRSPTQNNSFRYREDPRSNYDVNYRNEPKTQGYNNQF